MPPYDSEPAHRTPPQLSQLIQTRRLRFFGHVARMGTSLDITRALKVSIRRLSKDWRRPPARSCPCHTWLRTVDADLQPNTLRIENIGSTSRKPLRYSSGHALDDDDDDDDDYGATQERRYATVCRLYVIPSARPSVWDVRYRDHIGWNTSKIISRLISLRFMLGLIPTWAIWANGNTSKIKVEYGWVMSTKVVWCKPGQRLLWRTHRKSHTRFRFVPKSMTLDDLERPKRSLAEKIVLRSPPKKIEWRQTQTLRGKM